MNTETGKLYMTPEEVKAAKARGEPLIELRDPVGHFTEQGKTPERVKGSTFCPSIKARFKQRSAK